MPLQFENLMKESVAIIPDRLWRLETAEGSFALKKLDEHSLSFHNVESGEAIAQLFKQLGLPVIVAVPNKERFILEFDNQYFLIFPWCSGKVLSSDPVNHVQANAIGNLLANFHRAKIEFSNANNAIWQDFQWVQWQELTTQKIADQLECWSELYFKAREKLQDQPVVSHGDLIQQNVIWDQVQQPQVIDWEAAGWIHPQIELLGVALNWSGINVDKPVPEIFDAVLTGYQNAGGEVLIDQTVFYASFGSWLTWLAFNLRSFAATRLTTFQSEVERTLVTMGRLEAWGRQL